MTDHNVLYLKYRPTKWGQVIGQKEAVDIMVKQLNDDSSHSFLLTGPTGVGKTTLARIGAKFVNCDDPIEINGATTTSVDHMRELLQLTAYRPLISEAKVVIVDECHRISKQAWDSALKGVEEPPDYVYWFFCTTAVSKVPDTIKSRCVPIKLKAISSKDLLRMVEEVADAEKFKISDEVVRLVVQQSNGSARQALVNLSMCASVTDVKQAAEILQTSVETDAVRDLCQYLLGDGSWAKGMAILEKLEDENPEGIRIQVLNYMAAVARNKNTDKDACAVLGIMEHFSTPYAEYENMAPLIISVGRARFTN